MKKDLKIAFIIPYFGNLPNYFEYFIKTCYYNKSIDFIFFCDKDINLFKHPNVLIHRMSIGDFNSLASTKTGFDICIKSGYKLCDIKPLYGHIFEDYLTGYDYWGFCDVDLIFGDLSKVLTENYVRQWDVISAHDKYLSGPFSLFRNDYSVNRLYAKSKDIERVLSSERTMLFDEASNVISYLWSGHDIFDFESEVESMTHILKNPKKNQFKVTFAGFITEKFPGNLLWEDGLLIDEHGKEHSIYHFMWYKNNFSFIVPRIKNSDKFIFSEIGFNYGNKFANYSMQCSAFVKNVSVRGMKKVIRVLRNKLQ